MRGATFSAAEIWSAPNVVSLLRVPLAIAFPFAARSPSPSMAIVVLGLAGATDVLDGLLARRLGAVTSLGAVIDPVADKIFALSAMGTLVGLHKLPWWGVPALLAREILEAPLLVWSLRRRLRGVRAPVLGSNVAGKVATIAQSAALLAAIAAPWALSATLGVAAAAAVVAGLAYWRREIQRARS
jgi:CDP-diacylglycerol--glycerol-3-phosphate 3-phosphatidyltransferase/cardiolipin synthase